MEEQNFFRARARDGPAVKEERRKRDGERINSLPLVMKPT